MEAISVYQYIYIFFLYVCVILSYLPSEKQQQTSNSNRPNQLPAGHHGTSPDRWHEASGWAAPRVHTRQLGPGKRLILVFAIYIYIYGCKMYGWIQSAL